ncbi:MAG: CapA family protein [Eubacteriales bacterium]
MTRSVQDEALRLLLSMSVMEPEVALSSILPLREPEAGRTVKLSFGGDVSLSDLIGEYADSYGIAYPFADVKGLLSGADIACVNLETSVSERGQSEKPEGYGFRTSPDKLDALKGAGIDIVSCANNHVRDYGTDAFSDTMKWLDEYGIKHAGIGQNAAQAQGLTVLDAAGYKVGYMAMTSIIPKPEWIAGEDSPGLSALRGNTSEIISRIRDYDKRCDILVVSLHWGVEYDIVPQPWQESFARALIDAGADVIYGHHPHMLQGIEIYKNKPILYSTGNFLFFKRDETAGETGVFELEMDEKGLVIGRIRPIFIKGCRTNLLREDDEIYLKIIKNMNALSEKYNTEFENSGFFRAS